MCFYIGIEDLAANALMGILTQGNKRFVTYEELEDYGAEVVSILSQKGEKAVLILSRENTNAMFRNYSEFFEEVEGEMGIVLREGVLVEDLEEAFTGYLALDVLMAFIDKRSLAKLGVGA